MRCPKCGKVLAKTNNGSYICSPDCKYVSLNQNYTNDKQMTNDYEDYESENKSSTNDWIFEPSNGFSRGW